MNNEKEIINVGDVGDIVVRDTSEVNSLKEELLSMTQKVVNTKAVEKHMRKVSELPYLADKEKVAALKILNILNEENCSVFRAAKILDYCDKALQFSKVSHYR